MDGIPDDDLFLPGRLDSIRKVLVIHRIYLSRTPDQRRIGQSLGDLLRDGAVGACVEGCSQDRGRAVVLRDLDQAEHVCAELVRFKVTDELDQAGLVDSTLLVGWNDFQGCPVLAWWSTKRKTQSSELRRL